MPGIEIVLLLILVAAGVVAFRWDINLSGFLVIMPYVPGRAIAYTSYRPSIIEAISGAAIIAYGLTDLSLGVKYLRVVDHSLVEKEHEVIRVKAGEGIVA